MNYKLSKLTLDNFLPYLNTRFLYYALWQIKAEDLQSDPELKKEIDDKYTQMLEWANDIVIGAYSFYIPECPQTNNCYQLATLGQPPVDKAHQLKENSEYADYFYWHGFCAALTEALAAKVHSLVRVEAGIEPANIQSPKREFSQAYIGKRLSWGYSALPNIEDQRPILDLLSASEIGVSMTDSGMLQPEYSTCAMVVIKDK